MAEKLYYSMGEVSEMFDVRPSLIRYWGSQFDVLRPKRNKKGNRMFSPEDIATLKLIYHLVKERGMTIDGARRHLKSLSVEEVAASREVELLDRLQRLKAMLLQVREQIGDDRPANLVGDDIMAETESRTDDNTANGAQAAEAATESVAAKGVAAENIVAKDTPTKSAPAPQKTTSEQEKPAPAPQKTTSEQEKSAPAPQSEPVRPAKRELPFYEQTLF